MAMQQPRVRDADETICFKCNAIVKRDARLCPQCGGTIATGPSYVAQAPPQIPGASPDGGTGLTYSYQQEDVVGIGRWVLNFLLAGLLGLAITFFLRKQGWMATWICGAIFVAGIALVILSQPS
jgi:hypothetical protein